MKNIGNYQSPPNLDDSFIDPLAQYLSKELPMSSPYKILSSYVVRRTQLNTNNLCYFNFRFFSLKLLVITKILLKAIAKEANIGCSFPIAAVGINITL